MNADFFYYGKRFDPDFRVELNQKADDRIEPILRELLQVGLPMDQHEAIKDWFAYKGRTP